MTSTRFFQFAVLLVAVSTLPACGPSIVRPQLAHPGPAPFQRARAVQFDPYPPNDVAPEIVGGRPAGYVRPPNEVERSRQHQPFGPWSNPTPAVVTPAPIPSGPVQTGPPLY